MEVEKGRAEPSRLTPLPENEKALRPAGGRVGGGSFSREISGDAPSFVPSFPKKKKDGEGERALSLLFLPRSHGAEDSVLGGVERGGRGRRWESYNPPSSLAFSRMKLGHVGRARLRRKRGAKARMVEWDWVKFLMLEQFEGQLTSFCALTSPSPSRSARVMSSRSPSCRPSDVIS